MRTSSGRRGARRVLLGVVVGLGVSALLASAAFGADSVYWDASIGGTIWVGNLDGSGSPTSLVAGETTPEGVAIDPATGKIYWADYDSGAIQVGNLDGSGTPQTLFTGEQEPLGIAIDPAAGKLYWASYSDAIRVGNLDGSGTPQTLFTDLGDPSGVAIDPATGKIYWADYGSGTIQVGNLDGSGTPQTLFTDANGPSDVAIDPATGKIYWPDENSGTIRVGSLDGTGTPQDLFTGGSFPESVAIDPAAGKIYWPNLGSGAIQVGNLDGSGTPTSLFTGESGDPRFLALLRAPAGAGAPAVSGGSGVGSVLSCSQGSWSADLPGAFLYRAPQHFSYQWSRNGGDIAGAGASSYLASTAGAYACQVTATNQAGSSTQTSAPYTIAAPAPSPPSAPALSGLGASPRTLSLAGRLIHGKCVRQTRKNTAHRRCRRAIKLRIRYTLNASATVRFTFKRLARGRQVNRRCVRPTKQNDKRSLCTRMVAMPGTITTNGSAGRNSLTFNGRISGKRLSPGRYQLIATPSAFGNRGLPRSVTFRLLR